MIPTEYEECCAFSQWLKLKNITHHHIASESQSGRYGAIRGAKLKRMGQSRGFPDYLIFIPMKNIIGYRGDKEFIPLATVAVEMKRKKGGKVSEEQKNWLLTLESAGIETFVAKGTDEAIKFIEERMK